MAIALAVVVLILGGVLLWFGTAGLEWNNTHDRAGRPTARVSKEQATVNRWLFRIIGLVVTLGALVSLAAQLWQS